MAATPKLAQFIGSTVMSMSQPVLPRTLSAVIAPPADTAAKQWTTPRHPMAYSHCNQLDDIKPNCPEAVTKVTPKLGSMRSKNSRAASKVPVIMLEVKGGTNLIQVLN